MGRRFRVLLAAATLAIGAIGVSVVASPAGAGNPNSTATASFSITSGGGASPCVFSVTYTWSGFNGRDRTAQLSLLSGPSTGQLTTVETTTFLNVKGHSGTVTAPSFTSSNPNFAFYRGQGVLLMSDGTQVSGSLAESPTASAETC
jgi:hypothetical protein